MKYPAAAFIVAILVALAILTGLAVSDYLTADKCLDAGGAWNRAQARCSAPGHHSKRQQGQSATRLNGGRGSPEPGPHAARSYSAEQPFVTIGT